MSISPQGAHTLTILSICSTLVYFTVYNRGVIRDLLASDSVAVPDFVQVNAKREFSVSATTKTNWTGSAVAGAAAVWHPMKLEESAAWHPMKLSQSSESSLKRLAPQVSGNRNKEWT